MRDSDGSTAGPAQDSIDVLKSEIEDFVSEYLPGEPRRSSSKVVHDGLWGTIKLCPLEVCLVDTPLLQRLRQIHQMGCTLFTYPSTTHSRFEHTLGVIHQIERLPKALLERTSEPSLRREDIDEMRLAALLHDVGHGPFSHTSEEVYGNLPVFRTLRTQLPGRPHEILGHLILKSRRLRDFLTRAADIHACQVSIEDLASHVVGQRPAGDRPYKMELLSGPFDADKLDYLFRDSHFSGLPLSVDLDRLFYTVRVARIMGEERLAVLHTGATALEQIFFSKMVLFTTVYHHHKVRACDCMFAGIIEYMKKAGITMAVGRKELTWESPVDFLRINDGELVSFGFRTEDKDLHVLIHDLFFRRLLKRALIISMKTIEFTDEDRWDDLQRDAKESPQSWVRRREVAREIWEQAGKPCLLQQVWVDLPELPSVKAADETFVLPGEFGAVEPVTLNDIFPTGEWTKQYGENKWRGHVFCPDHAREAIGRAAKGVIEKWYGVRVRDEAFLWCKNDPPK